MNLIARQIHDLVGQVETEFESIKRRITDIDFPGRADIDERCTIAAASSLSPFTHNFLAQKAALKGMIGSWQARPSMVRRDLRQLRTQNTSGRGHELRRWHPEFVDEMRPIIQETMEILEAWVFVKDGN